MKRCGKRLVGAVAGLLLAAAPLIAGGPAAAAPGPNQLSLTIKGPDGTAINNALVKVYFIPFDPSSNFVPSLLATGRTGSTGNVLLTLDTTKVTGSLAYSYTGIGAYNAQTWAIDPSHHWLAIHDEVFILDDANADTITADLDQTGSSSSLTDADFVTVQSVTLQPDAADPDGSDPLTPTLTPESGSAGADVATDPFSPTGADVVIDTTKRWVKVLAWNVSAGMKSTFTYSNGKATSTETAVSAGGSNWSVGGWAMEETDRGASASVSITGKYHRIRYAHYRYYEYLTCSRAYCIKSWKPHHWTGGLDNGGDYDPPAFDSKHAERLPSGGAERHTNQAQRWGIGLKLAGLSLGSNSAFATNTRVTWDPVSGCGQTRYLWAKGQDWTVAGIVQASCR